MWNNTSTSTYSLDQTDPKSLPYFDNLRLLAAKAKGEAFPADLEEKELIDLENVDFQVREESSECSQIVGVTITPKGGYNTNTSNSTGDTIPSAHTINLGHIISVIPTSHEDYLLDSAASATLAIHHFNTGDPSVLPFLKLVNNGESSSCSIRFTHEFFDSERNPITASRIYLNEIRPRKPHFLTPNELKEQYNRNEPINRQVARPYPTALIGAQTSETTHSLVTLTGIYNLVQISHASTASKFDDKHLFPNFGRVVPSTDGDAKVALDFIHDYLGSSFAGVLYERGPFGDSFANALQNAAENKVKLDIVPIDSDHTHVNFHQSIVTAVSHLAQTKFNIIFAIVKPSNYEQLMEEAYRQGIAGPGHLWLFASIPTTFFNHKKYPAGSPLAIATHGIGLLKLGTPIHTKLENSVIHRFLKVWKTVNEPEFKEYFKSKQPRYDKTKSFHKVDHYDFSEVPTWLSLFLYDAVISICLSACKLEHINKSPHFTPTELIETFKNINFEGVTGSVIMDEHASRKYTTVTYYMTNVVANEVDDDGMISFSLHEPLTYSSHRGSTNFDNEKVKLPYYRQEESGVTLDSTWQQVVNRSKFIYSSSNTTPPLPIPPLEMNVISISTPVQIIGLSLGAIASVTSIFFFIWTLKNIRSRIVRLGQPIFLLLICTGCFIMSLSIIPLTIKVAATDESCFSCLKILCYVGPALYKMGYALIVTSLFAKNSRFNMAVSRNPLERLPISSRGVMLKFSIILLWNVFAIFFLILRDDLEYSYIYGREKDIFQRSTGFIPACKVVGKSRVVMFLAILSDLIFVAAVTYQSFRSSHLARDFNDGRQTVYALFIVLEALIILGMIYHMSQPHPDFFFMGLAWVIFECCLSILLCLFIPKIFALNRDKAEQQSLNSSRSLMISISQYRSNEEVSASQPIRSLDIGEPPMTPVMNDESDITN